MYLELKGNIGVMDIILHLIVWLLIIVCTAGFAIMFYPYGLAKFLINGASVEDPAIGKVYQMNCNIGFFEQIGNIILWLIIVLVTCGLAYPFYLFKVFNFALNRSEIGGEVKNYLCGCRRSICPMIFSN